MHPLTDGADQPRLAAAFLALCDLDGDAGAPVRASLAATLAAIAACLLLALSGPLAWISGPGARPSGLLTATPAAKAAMPAPDDAGDGGG
jgi:hypothetical protein